MEQKNNKFCRKCLLEDFAPDEYLQNMRTYIKSLAEESKVEDNIYNHRLAVCRECENLYEGMCRICGCFVEYRAALKIKDCPDVTPRW
jgi:hypothetical protein